jgi:hypothetical protein
LVSSLVSIKKTHLSNSLVNPAITFSSKPSTSTLIKFGFPNWEIIVSKLFIVTFSLNPLKLSPTNSFLKEPLLPPVSVSLKKNLFRIFSTYPIITTSNIGTFIYVGIKL